MASSSSCSKSTSKDRKDFRNKKSDKETSNAFPITHNVFANDGSFFEMFQKMKEMEQAKGMNRSGLDDKNLNQAEKDNTRTNQTDNETSDDSKPGTSSLSLQGKRKVFTGKMGGASKQLAAKKKREEKEKEKEKNEEQKVEDKSSAWKAYLDEVKKYREKSCTDDSDRVRPLVK